MINYDEAIQRIRRSLINPEPHMPGDDLILQCLAEATQELRNRASLLGSGIEQGFKEFPINASTVTYKMTSVPQAGRIIRVHVTDPDSPGPLARYFKVPVIERQDIGNYSEQFNTWQMPTACVVWIEDGIRVIEFVPRPARNLTCKVWFEVGYEPVGRTDALGLLPEFHHLLRLKGAMSCVTHCEWGDLRLADETIPALDREKFYMAAKMDRRKELKNDFAAALAQQEIKFDQYVAKLSVGGTESSANYAQDYMDSIW